MKEKKKVMFASDEAAQFKTVTGWVDRHGVFYGNDLDSEQAARYGGCTHQTCECGAEHEKTASSCTACREKRYDENYAKAPRKPWDGKAMLYSDTKDRCYSNYEELLDELKERGGDLDSVDDLRVYICEPVFANEVDPYDTYGDDPLPDDELPDVLLKAFDVLNAVIRAYKEPLYWCPGKFAADLSEFLKEQK